MIGGNFESGRLGKSDAPPIDHTIGHRALPPPAVAAVADSPPADLVNLPTIQAVVRYKVSSVDGLFNMGFFAYRLRLRCRGQISANLIEVDLASGIEKTRIHFNSNNHNNFEDQDAFESAGDPPQSIPFDFDKKAYYVEATLTASAVAIGHPAAISIIQISAPSTIILRLYSGCSDAWLYIPAGIASGCGFGFYRSRS
jgi:hypothetical protein